MALSMHLYYIATQANNVPHSTPFAIATVLIGVVLIVNAAAIAFRVYLRSRKKW
jgi:ABC-type phosphate transport system permease subunit